MLQKKAKKRATLLTALLLVSLTAIFLVLKALDKNILYFKSPTEIKASQDTDFNKKLRVGGMVKKDSVIMSEEEIKFIITDYKNELKISYSGTVPNLFSEEKGVVAEGMLKDKDFFIADRILAKHDENYMPPELKNIMNQNAK
jgi:cytochrome c-type biogenesis protein CcmE